MGIKNKVKSGVTLLLFMYLAYKVDWIQAGKIIANIRLLPFVLSYCILLLSFIPLALRLSVLLQPTALQFSLKRLVEIQFISQFYGMLLPSGIGLAVVRWYKITQNRSGRRVFVVVTIIERVMLVLTLALCAAVPLFFVKDESLQGLRGSVLPVLSLIILVCLLFFAIFFSPWMYGKFSLFMQSIQSKFNIYWMKQILGIYEDFGLYLNKQHLLSRSFFFHLIFHALIFVRFYLVFTSLDIDLPPVTILWISMLVLLILSLPITLGGLGVREAGFAWFFTLYDIGPERGVVLGGLLSVQLLFNQGIGGLLSLAESKLKGKGQDS